MTTNYAQISPADADIHSRSINLSLSARLLVNTDDYRDGVTVTQSIGMDVSEILPNVSVDARHYRSLCGGDYID